MPGANPGEGYANTNLQLFSQSTPPDPAIATNRGFVTDIASTLAGADANEPVLAGTVATDIMGMFTPDLLPILSGLAHGYAVCDQWFSSVPTMTLPNHAFLHAGTSLGHIDKHERHLGHAEHLRAFQRAQSQLVHLRVQPASAHPTGLFTH